MFAQPRPQLHARRRDLGCGHVLPDLRVTVLPRDDVPQVTTTTPRGVPSLAYLILSYPIL